MGIINFSSAVEVSPSVIQALALQSTVAAYGENFQSADISTEEMWRMLSSAMTILNHTNSELSSAQHQIQVLQSRVNELELLTTTDTLTEL